MFDAINLLLWFGQSCNEEVGERVGSKASIDGLVVCYCSMGEGSRIVIVASSVVVLCVGAGGCKNAKNFRN